MARTAKRRMRIYALMGDHAALRPVSQDQIDEARFLTALSTFADVFYNGQRFDPDIEGWGLDATAIAPPGDGYDIYYVNDNPPVFLNCPSPRVARVMPHDAGVFHAADALLTTTGRWKRALEALASGSPAASQVNYWYRDLRGPLPTILAVPPGIDAASRRTPAQREVTAARAVMSFGRIVGYFGPGRDPVFPSIFLSAYQVVRRFSPELIMAIGSGLDGVRPAHVVVTPPVAHALVPAYVKACFAVVAEEGPNAEVVASSRISEALSVGTPIIALRTDAHVEQLGSDYPLFYTDRDTAIRRLLELTFDRGLASEVRDYLAARAAMLTPEIAGEKLKAEFEALIATAAAR